MFPVIETFNVHAAIAIQKRTQATVKTWETMIYDQLQPLGHIWVVGEARKLTVPRTLKNLDGNSSPIKIVVSVNIPG